MMPVGELPEQHLSHTKVLRRCLPSWKGYLVAHGKPKAIYLDQFSTYKMNPGFAQDNHDLKTQFERAMQELNIELITAYSPEAKGRVERLFGTLQDRLIKELRLKRISPP